MLEVDEVFVVLEDLDVGEGTPGLLDLLDCDEFLALDWHLLLLFLEAPPRPLDLDRSNVVHGKAVVLEQSASQSHLVSGLDQSSAVVAPTSLFTLVQHIER